MKKFLLLSLLLIPGAVRAVPVVPNFQQGSMTSHTETESTVTPAVGTDGNGDGATGVLTSTFDSLDMDSAGSFTISNPGGAFQFTQSYSGPGMTNQTIIQRVTAIKSVTDVTSTFTQ